MPRCVIFDCDGVLVDSEPIACRVDAACLTQAGLPISTEEIMARFVGMSSESIVKILSAEHGVPVPAGLDERRRARIMAAFTHELRPMPGVAAALGRIGLPKCVASSSHPERIAHALGVTGLLDVFGGRLFSATMVARGKPAPDLFLLAAERTGAVPADCIVIEDSIAGVTAGKRAGMAVLGFTGGSHCAPGHAERLRSAGADRVFAEMAELPELLEETVP